MKIRYEKLATITRKVAKKFERGLTLVAKMFNHFNQCYFFQIIVSYSSKNHRSPF